MPQETSTMRQATPRDFPSEGLMPLELKIQTGRRGFRDQIDVISDSMKGNIPQGSFFAYLFRRFGYPQRGWDPYKELAAYLLTTPRRDMLMRIAPYAEGDPDLSISFLVPSQVEIACRSYPHRFRDIHRDAFGDWVEATFRKPDWIEEWFTMATSSPGMPGPVVTNWKESLHRLQWARYFDTQKDEHPWYVWYQDTVAAYEAVHPKPAIEYRSADWTAWSDQDPMKVYVEAAIAALQDLHTPVWIRDCAIDPWGHVPDDDLLDFQGADRHPSAGIPSGALGNQAPQEFVELHGLILSLGDTPAEGISRAHEILAAHKEGQAQ